jgi:hypothetical protein
MTRRPCSSDRLPFDSKLSSSIAARRRCLRSQASRLTLRSTVAAAAFVGLGVFAPSEAWAQCVVGGVTVTCADTSTTDTTFPANPQVDRNYQGVLAVPIDVTVDSGATISGNGLAFTNSGTGGITVNNGGTISVDAGNTPTAAGTAALSLTALGGPIVYTGGDIINNGSGNAFDARQNGGVGSVSVTAGTIFSATGAGVTVRDVVTSTGISVTTGAVTALTAGKDGVNVLSLSQGGNLTEVANGDINAGNVGMVGMILTPTGTGNVNLTANGAITARVGVDAENLGNGSTNVTTVGPVNATTGNGIYAVSNRGSITVIAGDVTSTGNTAIVAMQSSLLAVGNVNVTAGNVSGTTGIIAQSSGTGILSVTANGTVTGTTGDGIAAIGNNAVTISVADTVTGAARGLNLTGGIGGAGNVSVTGAGGFFGGTGDGADILNIGTGTTTVDISGASGSTGGNGIFVRNTITGGNISVTTGAVAALTAGKNGIDVQTLSNTANVTEVANGDINAGNIGMRAAIFAGLPGGDINVTANGAINARFGVDAENFGGGSTSVTTVGPVNATTGIGIYALSNRGSVTVNAGDVTSTGSTGILALQNSPAGAGNVGVTAGNVSGITGIIAESNGTGTVSVTANGTVTGAVGDGITATGNNAVTISAADTVTGAARGLSLIGGLGGAGNVSVTGAGGFFGGTGDGANILNIGTGTTIVDISGASGSTGGNGIFVRDTAIGGDISVTTGAVTALTAGKNAIDVESVAAGNITVVANGDVQGGAIGVRAVKDFGTGNIDVTTGNVSGATGIFANNLGTGTVGVTTNGTITGTAAEGIKVLGNRAVSVAVADTVTGATSGLTLFGGIGGAGNISVTGTGGFFGGTGDGANILNLGTGTTTVDISGASGSTGGTGIFVRDTAVGGSISVTTGAVTALTAGRNAIDVESVAATSNVTVVANGDVQGGANGVRAVKDVGTGNIDVTTGNVSGATGIFANNLGTGTVGVTTNGTTTGTAAEGIKALGNGAVSVAVADTVTGATNGLTLFGGIGGAGNVSVTGAGGFFGGTGDGANIQNLGTGTTIVDISGASGSTGGNGIFVRDTAVGGNISVTTGAVTALTAGKNAIDVESVAATSNVTVVANGDVQGGANGVRAVKDVGTGNIDVTTGNVSGATGIFANNIGVGTVSVTTNGTTTGTAAEGIKALGNGAVSVSVADTVTGATNGLTLFGGIGGAGNVSVTGTGGFFGGTGDGANIVNIGTGTTIVDISGASGSTGGNGIFVRDTAAGGDISVTTGAVTALTAGKNAIDVISSSLTANVTEVANGNIRAGNAGMVAAIVPAAATGEVNVTANGSIDARFGVDAENFGSGNTLVTTVGPVNVTSGNGIFALSTGGHIVVTAGDVTSTGNIAIIAQQTKVAGAGLIGVSAGNVSGTTGIDVRNAGTGDIGVNSTGMVTGTAAEGIHAVGNAAVTVTTTGTVTGATRGLSLIGGTGGTGDLFVAGTGGFVGGSDDAANIQNNGAGTVTVDISGASSSTGGNGIFVRDTAVGGDISVTTDAVTTLAVGKNAIDVITQSTTADVTEVANGDINAGNAGIVGAIVNAAGTGNVDVTANGAITARFGVDAENFGSGSTSVTTVAPVNATSGNGIFALTTGGNVTVNAGDVSSVGSIGIFADNSLVGSAGIVDVSAGKVSGTIGVEAINNGTGLTSVATTGPVTGTLVDGIIAIGNGAVTVSVADAVTGATNGLTLIGGTGGAGNISVTGAGGFFGGTGDGANIKNNGSGTVTVDISGASGSTGGNGIVVRDTALGRDINVTTGAVTALAGGFNGVDVFGASNTGNVTVVTNGAVQGGNAGIVAGLISTSTGNVDVTANGAVSGKFGVDAENYGTGNVTVTTIGPVTATTGYGIVGLTDGGNVVVNAGNVSSTGAAAILAEQIAPGGAGTVGVTAGNVSGTRGIIAQTNGTGGISVSALGNVTATNGNGIEAVNYNAAANAGTITVAQAAGTKLTATGGSGIYTDSGLSTGMTTITVAGEITAGTPGFAGVYGTSTKGGITVNVTGTGKIDPDYGIDLNTVDGPLVVNNAGLVTGTIDGVRLVATGTGSANISNTGTITGGTNAVLISVNNTPSTLFNSGTINGAVKMLGTTVATSNWINSPTGIANLTGASSISGNLVNGGNVNLGAGGTLTVLGNTNNAGRVTFAGAGTFTTMGSMANTGIINAQNNLSGNVVTVGGNYTGGGQFFADYSPATVTADRLNIGGTASGNTNVTMNLVGARAFVPGGFLPVVTVAGAVPANAFTSSTVFATTGFILDSFGQNPSNAHQFGVIQTVNTTAAGLGNLSYMAESASGLLDDPISPFVTNRTDAGGTRFSLWMRGSGGHSTQTISSSLSGGGMGFATTSRFRTSQHAAQIGGDISFGGIGGGWKVNVGVMGGWYGASAPLGGGERIKVETPFVGGYAVVGNGAFELEGNIRKEWRHYTVAMPSLFGTVGTQRMRGDATAGSARISYRVGGKTGFAATPFVAFNYADTKIDPLAIDAFTVWTAGSDTTKIGQAGLRLSYRGGSEATATFEPFISAARMENWSRGDSSSFAFGAPVTTFSLQSNTWKNAMRYSAGILANAHGSRVSGFVVGNIDDDSRLRSFTIHAGLRFNF